MEDMAPFLAGLIMGLAGGLLPAMHPNTMISILSSLGFESRALAMMITGLYPSSMVMSFIPSVFFGIPDRSTVVAALPGQRMVMEGNGLSALKVMLLSAVFAALLSCVLFLASLGFFPLAIAALKGYMGYVLAGMTIVFLIRSRNLPGASALFLLSGGLGWFSMNSGMADPFLPLFSGMFAMAAIANYRKSVVPAQFDNPLPIPHKSLAFYSLIGVMLGMFADIVPGIGSPAQVATFATMLLPMDTFAYLATVSALSVSQALFSLSTSASIDKSRVGATAWLSGLIDIKEELPLILTLFILSIGVAAVAAFLLRKHAARLASIDWSVVNPIIAAYLMAITLIIDGPLGLVVLWIGCGIGWLAVRSGVERTNLMGAVILPTLLLLFRIF